MWKYILTAKAIESLEKIDIQMRTRIFKKMDFYIWHEDPLVFAVKLVNSQLWDYRFRIGDYRVVCDVDKQWHIIIIAIIWHRKEIYN